MPLAFARSMRWTLVALVLTTAPAIAQTPAQAPPKIWTVAASAGYALTSGNTHTSSFNVGYDLAYDPHTKNLVKSDGLVIRAKNEGELTTNRIGLNVRDEYKLNARVFVFGQNQYLRDEFKNIDYLLAPTGGVGYKIFDTEATKLGVDASAGAVWEKNPGLDVGASGALVLGQKLTQRLSPTATLTQSFSGLWKTNAFDDALYTAGIGLAASVSTRTQLKVEVLDTFKNKPPSADIQKNDIAVLMAIVYKI